LKTFFDKEKARDTYDRVKPYIVLSAAFLLSCIIYVLNALNQLRIRARLEPFIFLAAVATGIYAVFAYRQWEVMSGQLGEMQEEHRPWMQGDVQFVGPLVFDKDGARAPINLLLKNSGKSPAKNVWRGVRMYAGDGPDTLIMSWENALCQGIIRDSGKGITIFPNESPGSQMPVGIDAAEIQKNISADGVIIVRIIMCIDYAFPFSPVRHQTSYIWEVDKKDPISGFTHIKPSDGAIQPNELLKLTDPSLPGRAN
jgi:hypothetical protein